MVVLGAGGAIAIQQWLKGFVDDRVQAANIKQLIIDQLKSPDLARAAGIVTAKEAEDIAKRVAIPGPPGKNGAPNVVGISLVAGGIVDDQGNKIEHFGPLDFSSSVEGGTYRVRFIGPAPSKEPFVLIGSTRSNDQVSPIVIKRDRDGFQIDPSS
jgi:hypothetical protein